MQTMKPSPFSILALHAEPEDTGSQICTGIICPVVPEPWPVITLPSSVNAWRSVDREMATLGLHPTLVRPLGDDLDSRIRAYSYDVSVFLVRGKPSFVPPPYLMMPYPDLQYTVITVELELFRSTLFSLAGYQCYLWTAVMGAMIWQGAWNTPDPYEVRVARETIVRPGDALPILIRGEKALSGVALLGERISERLFSATLYMMCRDDCIKKGVCLLTASATEIEGTTNRFETPFAWIR